jgi:hypothetical protein
MKKIIFFNLFLSLLLISTVTSSTYSPEIEVKTAYTNPYPAEPGKSLILSIAVSNNGNREAKNAIIELDPVKPFILLENPRKEIGTINIGDSRILSYNLFVDNSAVSTTYELPVHITYDNLFGLTGKVEVRVQGKPEFRLLEVKSETISPGDQAEISIYVQNIGSGKAKKTTATFSSSSAYIKPIFSGGYIYVGDVEIGEKKEIKFKVLANSDSEYGVYSSTVNITCEDEFGNKFYEKFDVGILISGEPKFQIVKTKVDATNQELSVEIANIGSAEARKINGKLILDNKTFDVDYVTSVKIDKHTTLRFNLPNTNRGELELTYEGPDNEKYSQKDMISWSVQYTFPNWVIAVVILVIVYILWKKKWLKKIF